jgi:hypothetical protein
LHSKGLPFSDIFAVQLHEINIDGAIAA